MPGLFRKQSILFLLTTVSLLIIHFSVPDFSSIESSADFAMDGKLQAEKMMPGELEFMPASGPTLIGQGLGKTGKVEWQALCNVAYLSGCVGYAGPIILLVGIDSENQVTGVRILDHKETPSFVKGIEEPWFLDQFIGKQRKDSLEPYVDLDGITDATITVKAICQGVRTLLEHADGNSPKPSLNQKSFVSSSTIFLILAFLLFFLRRKISGNLSAFLVLLGMGVFSKQFISLVQIPIVIRFLKAGILPWSILMIWLAGAICVILRPRGYCMHLCPMGRLQDLLSQVKSLFKSKDSDPNLPSSEVELFVIGRVLLWGFLLFSLFLPKLSGDRFEVFSALFQGNQGVFGWVLVASSIVGSSFMFRFYCRVFCPLNSLFIDLETVLKRNTVGEGKKEPNE